MDAKRKNRPILGYWFAAKSADGKVYLPHGDGREVKAGETLTVTGPIIACKHGLHASRRAIDALGKEVLYALKAATDQLAAKHGVRMTIVSQATEDGIRVVTVRAEAKDGRVTEEIGALPIKGLTGEAMSNALMKCVTKAKRRAVLSLCGLGLLDETEVESIPNAAPVVETAPVVVVDPPKPAPAAQVKPPPAYVAALWKRCHDAHGSEAREKLHTAAIAAMGENYPPSREWTKAQADSVESVLFPGDISY